jgi:hypothetical protein
VAELYRESVRRYSGAEVQWSDPRMATRSVDKNGKFAWKQQKVFLTSGLAGWQVGLQRTEQNQLEAWIGWLLLGYFDPLNRSFLQSDIRAQTPETKELKQ